MSNRHNEAITGVHRPALSAPRNSRGAAEAEGVSSDQESAHHSRGRCRLRDHLPNSRFSHGRRRTVSAPYFLISMSFVALFW